MTIEIESTPAGAADPVTAPIENTSDPATG